MVLVSMILFELLRAFSCRSMQFTIVQLGFFTNRVVLAPSAPPCSWCGDLHSVLATAFHTVSIGWRGVALGVGGVDSSSWKWLALGDA
jgi:hypothetical protein